MLTILIRWRGDKQELVRKIGRTAIRVGRAAAATTMYQGSTESSPGTITHAWSIGGGRIADVRLIFDALAHCTYLSLRSVDPEAARRVLGSFAERLEAIPVTEALAEVEQIGGRDPQSYVRLALASGGNYSKSIETVVSQSLRSEQHTRRRGAALAIGLLLWSEFLSPVMEALKIETDDADCALLTVAYRQLIAGATPESLLPPGIM